MSEFNLSQVSFWDNWSGVSGDTPESGVDDLAQTVHTEYMPKGWLTTDEVALRLGIKRQAVRDMLRAKRFENAEQHGGVWFIPEKDLIGIDLPRKGRPPKRRRNTKT